MTNTRVAAGLYLATSIYALCSKSVTSCLEEPLSVILLFRGTIFWLLETRIANLFSPATLRVVVLCSVDYIIYQGN